MFKKLFIPILFLSTIILANDFGIKASLVMPEYAGFGVGFGFLGLININQYVDFYPNLECWFGHENSGYYYNDQYYYQYNYDMSTFETAFNIDFKFNVPVHSSVIPYFGLGIAPVITYTDCNPGYSFNDFGPAFNMFGGMQFKTSPFFFELRGKIGSKYSLFKMTAGMTFGDEHIKRK